MKWLIIFALCLHSQNCLELISSTRSAYLQAYNGYVDIVPIHLEIPKEVSFASIKFVGDEEQASIFGCTPRKALLFFKPKSLPAINLDNSIIPKNVKNVSRPEPYFIEMISDKKLSFYHNLTSPEPGCYYIAASLPYADPKQAAIKPPGLSPECYAYFQVSLYVKREENIGQILDGQVNSLTFERNSSHYFKFYVPELVSRAIIIIDKFDVLNDNSSNEKIMLFVQANSLPNENNSLNTMEINVDSMNSGLAFNTKSGNWHYAKFQANKTVDLDVLFTLKFFFEDFDFDSENVSKRIFKSGQIENVMPLQQFDLIRESASDSFSFSFELPHKPTNIAINLTENEFSILKFKLRQHTDIGGALHFTLAFKPRLNRDKSALDKEPDSHVIIACLRPESAELPTWPNKCQYESDQHLSPMILNKTTTNTTMIVPFPDSGTWYASFKLFCGNCVACNCSHQCRKQFDECVNGCETSCLDTETCYNCSIDCKNEIVAKKECAKCDCDGACLKSDKDNSNCNSSVIFDVSSTPCVNSCGKNGRCMFVVSDGFVYSTCLCTNNYRGWDCSDSSNATPYMMVVLELLLLVLSNLMFLPTVYVAYKRNYYIEAICYFSIFFFSTFYHACDAGENIISFCLTRMNALQFADFYCALLSIWVTLIAIADLANFWPMICQMTGAIILSFITTINKTAAWVFIVPASAGAAIITLSWFLKWRKLRQNFLNRRYLRVYIPLGLVVGATGILIYTLLETANNYKYLHSLWHVIMAVTVILLLPRDNTFQPETIL